MVGVSKALRNGVAMESQRAKLLTGYLGFCGIIGASLKPPSLFEEIL